MQEWTVDELIRNQYRHLGVPHFQRGLVWNKDAVSRLLESLFHDTPCGTLLLWQPASVQSEGIPLVGAECAKYLIIDGQQRIRSIHDAFLDFQSESTEADDEDSQAVEGENGGAMSPEAGSVSDQVWCLNLTRISGLTPLLDDRLQGYPLFMHVKDPRSAGKKRFANNLVAIRSLLNGGSETFLPDMLRPETGVSAKEVLRKINSSDIAGQVRRMRERRFPVIIKQERDGKNGLSELVQIYNRINSGGVRVESEEKAFATLVSLRSEANRWLDELFREFHPRTEAVPDASQLKGRDDVLQRTKEKNFGFKLFMRTFVQACNFHFELGLGPGSFSFDVLQRPATRKRLMNSESARKIDKLFDYARRTITYVYSVLSRDLYCDSLQLLPETASLMPVFQLLLKYPQVMDDDRYRPLVRMFILRLMLLSPTQREVLEIIGKIRRTHSLASCFPIACSKTISAKTLSTRMAYSNSLQDRYVLLLYWLERKNGARDFSYKNLEQGPPSRPKGVWDQSGEVPIEARFDPEKQHIVPYSKLADFYSLQGRSRVSSHPANNIGNVTYISRALNSFDGGLGAEPFDWTHDDKTNLRSHFLLGGNVDRGDSELLALYDEIVVGRAGRAEAKKKFEKLCKLRVGLIAEGFCNWVSELESSLPPAVRVRPVGLLFCESKSDKLLDLQYAEVIEDEIFKIMDRGATTGNIKNVPISLNILHRNGRSKTQIVQLQLKENCLTLKINQPDTPCAREVASVIESLDPRAVDVDSRGGLFDFAVRSEGVDATLQVLKLLSGYLERINGSAE